MRPHTDVSSRGGFSLIELLVTLALIATLSAIGVPMYMDSVETARVAKAAGDIAAMSLDIERFKELNGRYPASLAEVELDGWVDPWGQAYEYKKIEGENGNGGVRKDRFLVPLNSDFDLYSIGLDGATSAPLSAPAAHDDVLRANNGGYVGLAEDY